jgi:hypothetical protein
MQLGQAGFYYINYGGENADNLYTNPSFGPHTSGCHWANYQEAYDTSIKANIFSVIYYQAKVTPKHNGILFGLWSSPGAVHGGPNPLTQKGTAASWIKELNKNGANVTTVLFWTGLGYDPRPFIDGRFNSEFNEIRGLTF